MRLVLSSDQAFFRDTTAKFLTEQAPVGELRRLRHDPAGFDGEYWRQGAQLGWTSLLVGEEHGGGSISGDGLVDLTLVADTFGRHAAPGPLAAANVVAAALSRAGDAHADVVADLVSGTALASWCVAEPRPHNRLGSVRLRVRVEGGDVVVNGAKRPVESAAQASHLLVTGRTGEGLTQVLVPAVAPGVSIVPLHTVDLTRRFFAVTFDDVRVPVERVVGEIGGADAEVEHQRQLAAVVGTAEAVGAMQAAFELTVQWAFDRYSFGRPLASYQALKHRFADMKAWLEASNAVSDAAAAAVGAGSPEAGALVSVAKAYIGDYGSRLLQDCVQLHGGIGLTFEHDLHLFLRRHTVNRALDGTPADHRQRLADLVEQREDAA
ncbi:MULTISPECIES: acyl-CoA dehydrogenase family protein [unclassified Pseudofrankia]|uniref:acyl-CoA dehydrogenase family protein n=1 Tax=unclassified Pseudofrankia TaxID=2994372 RepID=UPI0008D9D1E0|nr:MULTISPECIES: acyl-CoA dehydrogenase family protein [unclassified Pseudofrankia]MDT3442191.1 acyl-CoA dehydrogenase family protein [Pseudofrankia sp. BMG5.37]OHV43592.1 acyl-CoA dehydrogenase [Pseudofrankia sp. BMG5.36]